MASVNETFTLFAFPSLQGGPSVRASVLAFLAVFGTVGNVSTVVAVCIDARLRTTSNYFVVLLASADVLFCAVIDPMAIITVTQEGWPLPEILCKITGMLSLLNLGVSVGTLAGISLNRYVCIVKFASYEALFTPLNTLVMCLIIIIPPVVISVLPLSGIGQYGYNPILGVCTLGLDQRNWIVSVTLFAVYTMTAEIFIVVCYSLIFIKVFSSRNRLRRNFRVAATSSTATDQPSIVVGNFATGVGDANQSQEADSNRRRHFDTSKELRNLRVVAATTPSTDHPAIVVGNYASGVDDNACQEADSNRRRLNDTSKEVKIAFNLFIVFILFFVSWMPITLMSLIDTNLSIPIPVWRMVATLAAANSSVNPCIYAWRNKQFRKAYIKILKCKFH